MSSTKKWTRPASTSKILDHPRGDQIAMELGIDHLSQSRQHLLFRHRHAAILSFVIHSPAPSKGRSSKPRWMSQGAPRAVKRQAHGV